jgi:hypothetical protein
LTVVQLALPTVALPQLSLAVWIVLMLLPIWLTILIAGRIFYYRKTMVDILGPEYAKNYTGVSAIVIESALPFTIISIILLGLFGDKNTAQNLFIPLMVQFEVRVFKFNSTPASDSTAVYRAGNDHLAGGYGARLDARYDV